MQSVPITTNIVSLNPTQAKQHYVIKIVSDLWLSVVSPDNPVSSTNKTDFHDVTKILLKVALNTTNTNQTKPNPWLQRCCEVLKFIKIKSLELIMASWNFFFFFFRIKQRMNVAKVNTDTNPELTSRFNIKECPTTYL